MAPGMGTSDQLALELLHPMLELVDDFVHSRQWLGSRGLGPHHTSAAMQRDLAHLSLGDARVALLDEADLSVVDAAEELREPRQLVGDGRSHSLGHLDVPTP